MSIEGSRVELTIRRANRADVETIVDFNLLGAKESANRDLSRDEVRAGVLQALKGHPDFDLLALRR